MKWPGILKLKNGSLKHDSSPDGSAAVDSFEDLRFDRAINNTRQGNFHTADETSKPEQYL